jgi:hypothetical protein
MTSLSKEALIQRSQSPARASAEHWSRWISISQTFELTHPEVTLGSSYFVHDPRIAPVVCG